MSKMFFDASSFNQDVGDWALHSVTDMAWMFHSATAFNQDLGDWRIDNVKVMGNMFHGASAFNQDLGWCVDHGVYMDSAFKATRCESTSCGVTHGICWGRGSNRRGISLVLVIVICLILAIRVPLAVSCCFLAGTFGSCSKHKKTPSSPSSSDKV